MVRSAAPRLVGGDAQDTYEDFATIGRRALEAVAERRGRNLQVAERDTILGTMLELPAHPEVPDALSRLRSAGFPLATLTNSSPEMVRAQLAHAGIFDLFDEVLSVEEVRRYKPAPEPYHLAGLDPISGTLRGYANP